MPLAEELPPLSPTAGFLLTALVLVGWVAVRVQVLRRQEARREPAEPEVRAWRWLRALARSRTTNLVLAVLAGLFAAAFAWAVARG
jgi:hypothetical protein